MVLAARNASAQDIHFSQFFASPLLQNPANAGQFDGKWRAGLNYRNQWQSFTAPWRTFDFYGDYQLLNKEDEPYFFGVGLILARDKAGDGDLGTTKVLGNGAVHVKLNGKTTHLISGGLQIGIAHKSIDWNKLYFGAQWNDNGFKTDLPQNENNRAESLLYPDVAAGVTYNNFSSPDYGYYVTASLMHVLKPKETFYNAAQENNLGRRPVLGAGGMYRVTETVSLHPSVHYMSQKKASEFLGGLMLGYDMSGGGVRRVVAYGGVYNRLNDAVYPTIGLDYGPWRGFVNYDINYSKLSVASGGRGAFELSLQYVGGFTSPVLVEPIQWCPRF